MTAFVPQRSWSESGVRPAVLTLGGDFDAGAAASLRVWLTEPRPSCTIGVVIDLRAAGALDDRQRRSLLEAAAIAPPGLALAAIVHDPAALQRQVGGAEGSAGGVRLRPVGNYADAVLTLRECAPHPLDDLAARHHRVVRKALRWAERSAATGDIADALGWLELARAVNGRLPAAWEMRRRRWERSRQPRPTRPVSAPPTARAGAAALR